MSSSSNSATLEESAAEHPDTTADLRQTHLIGSPDLHLPSRADTKEEHESSFSTTAENLEVHREAETLSQDDNPLSKLPFSSSGASLSGPTSNGKLSDANKSSVLSEMSASATSMQFSSNTQTAVPDSPTASQSPTGASSSAPPHTSASATEIAHKLMSSKREQNLEVKLRDLFEATKSLTAKENLLLSLRSVKCKTFA